MLENCYVKIPLFQIHRLISIVIIQTILR